MSEKHGYEDVSVSDVRELLSSKYLNMEYSYEDGMCVLIDESFIKNNSKGVLAPILADLVKAEKEAAMKEDAPDVDALEMLSDEIENESDMFIDVGDDDYLDLSDVAPVRPAFNSGAWSDWVKGQFHDNELDDGNPNCDGLRRLVQELVGPIVSKTIPRNETPTMENGKVATVVVGVRVIVTNEHHPLYHPDKFMEVYVEEVADCGAYNTADPYCKHQSATATTTAESRAYRKILNLRKVMTAEEANINGGENDWQPEEVIKESQILAIDILCRRWDINVLEFISSGKEKYESIYDVPYDKAQQMVQHLNSIQTDNAKKPSNVGSYNPSWKDEN